MKDEATYLTLLIMDLHEGLPGVSSPPTPAD